MAATQVVFKDYIVFFAAFNFAADCYNRKTAIGLSLDLAPRMPENS